MRLVNWLVADVCGIPVPSDDGPVARNEFVVRCAAGELPDNVPPVVAAILTRHAPAAARMNAFYRQLFGGGIHATYPAVEKIGAPPACTGSGPARRARKWILPGRAWCTMTACA